MDKIIDYAGQIGLKVILDNHSSAAGGGPNDNGLWYDDGYTEAQWISTWQSLATQYAGNSTVIGADLSNEPHAGATWGDGNAPPTGRPPRPAAATPSRRSIRTG